MSDSWTSHSLVPPPPPLDAAGLIGALERGLPDGRLVVDPDVLAAISHDDAEWAPAGRSGRPSQRAV